MNTGYYVVIRGVIPGIYRRSADVVENICDVQGAYVRKLPTLAAAIATWRRALSDGHATPLDIVAQPGDFGAQSETSSKLLDFASDLSLPFPTFESLETSAASESSTDDRDKWRTTGYVHGPKWVVWKGHLPGILDTW